MSEELEAAIRMLSGHVDTNGFAEGQVTAIVDSLPEATDAGPWRRVWYLAQLLEAQGEPDAADRLLEAVIVRYDGHAVAAQAQNQHALILAARGQHTEAEAKLADAFIVAAPRDPRTAATIADNLAVLATRRGAQRVAESWRTRKHNIHDLDAEPLDPLRAQQTTIDDAHRSIDEGQTATAIQCVRLAGERTKAVAVAHGDDSVEAALATAQLAHVKFRLARRRARTADMDTACRVLEAVGVVLGTKLGADDPRSLDIRVITRMCEIELAVVMHDEPLTVVSLNTELERLGKRVWRTRPADIPRQLLIDANVAVEMVEHARRLKSVPSLRMAITAMRRSFEAIMEHFGPEHPHAITARINLSGAEFDLACQERSHEAVVRARRELESAAAASRALADGHPVRVAAAHQLEVCRSLERGHTGTAAGGTDTRVATTWDAGGSGWNVRYSDVNRVGGETKGKSTFIQFTVAVLAEVIDVDVLTRRLWIDLRALGSLSAELVMETLEPGLESQSTSGGGQHLGEILVSGTLSVATISRLSEVLVTFVERTQAAGIAIRKGDNGFNITSMSIQGKAILAEIIVLLLKD